MSFPYTSTIDFTSSSSGHTTFFGYVLKIIIPGGILKKEVKPIFSSNSEAVAAATNLFNDLRKKFSFFTNFDDFLAETHSEFVFISKEI